MDGSGLIQVLVVLAAVVLAGVAIARAYRKSKQDAGRAEGAPGSDAIQIAQARGGQTAAAPAWERGTGRAILKEAWRLFRGQYWKIAKLFVVVMAVSTLLSEAASLVPMPDQLRMPFASLVALMIVPLSVTGVASASLAIWRGESPRLSLLTPFLETRRYFRAIWLEVLQGLAMALAAIPLVIGMVILAGRLSSAASLTDMGIGPVIVILLALAVMLWFALRMSIVPFALARRPEMGATEAFGIGFRATRGRLGAVLGVSLGAGWPLMVVVLVISLFDRSLGGDGVLTGWLLSLGYALLSGYYWLATAGLADRLLADGDVRRGLTESAPARPVEVDKRGGEDDL